MRVWGEIPPPNPCPFQVGAHYQVTRAFVAQRDEFRAGETLTFVRDAYSLYDGVTGYFFRDARGRTRVFDVDTHPRAGEPPEWDAFSLLPTPRPVRVAARLVLAYAALLAALSLAAGAVTRDWPPLWEGAAQACLGFFLAAGLSRLAGWAWWGGVGLGLWVGLPACFAFCLDLRADAGRLLGHAPVAPPALTAAHLLAALLLLPALARLLSREVRAAFGLAPSRGKTP